MKLPVIDASVALKWFFPEENSAIARSFLSERNQFVVPDLFWIETSNIISKKVRKSELSIKEAERIIQILENMNFVTISFDQIKAEAFFISTRFSITLYDACYLAVAVNYEGNLFTADIRMSNEIKKTAYKEFVTSINDL
ncbi:MAG: type II toxin-antitoxin system VapC family toxin [Balneola sp.]|jgi:predicted nucleic acid-binding protein